MLTQPVNFTGICCSNDNIAVGALRAIKEKGLKVPERRFYHQYRELAQCKLCRSEADNAQCALYDMGARAVEVIMGGEKN